MSIKVNYKGAEILDYAENGTKTLKTGGKYCEGDISITNTQDGGITPTGQIEITENGTYDVTEKASAVINVSGGGGNIASGRITVASDITTLVISDLPFVPNFGIVRCTDATKFNGVPKTLGNIYSGITDAEHGIVFRTNSGGTGVGSSSYTANAYAFKISGNSVSCACISGYPYPSGSTYEWRVGRAE